ncbi:DUF2510 domain-containing protein [Mycobacterium sp. M23085]|uniref:DUF2510 domain-containing protein n=1 Tax=Mycobacterium sp. M23085 TaxID=3378087 RepID=UPI003877AEFE
MSPWHWVILLLLFAVIVAVISGIVLVIVKLAKPKVPQGQRVSGVPSASVPGWYPDQQDQTVERYFDGDAWTPSTRPRC